MVRSRRAPSGADSWSDDEIDELIQDTVARTTPGQIILAANGAANDRQFAAWLRTTFRNELNRRARGTPLGRIIAAVDAALKAFPKIFRLVRDHWGLVGDEREPGWSGGYAELVAVARSIVTAEVRVARSATKTPALAARSDIRAVSEAVLRRSGPLPKAELARVHSDRFDGGFIEQLTAFEEDAPGSPDIVVDGTSFDAAVGEAQRILDELTEEDQRVLLACLTSTGLRGIGSALGCGTAKAQALEKRLQAKLGRLSAASDDPLLAVNLLLDLIRQSEQLEHLEDKDGSDGD